MAFDSQDAPMEQRALAFMGTFTQLQYAIDGALERSLVQQMPELGQLITKHHLRRIRDELRMPFLLALATDTGYHALPAFSRFIYDRAKQTRDLIGHSPSIGLSWNVQSKDYVVAIARYKSNQDSKVPEKITPETFDRLSNDCNWIAAHVWRLIYKSGTAVFLDFSGQPTVPDVPPRLPENGEPLPPGVDQD